MVDLLHGKTSSTRINKIQVCGKHLENASNVLRNLNKDLEKKTVDTWKAIDEHLHCKLHIKLNGDPVPVKTFFIF